MTLVVDNSAPAASSGGGYRRRRFTRRRRYTRRRRRSYGRKRMKKFSRRVRGKGRLPKFLIAQIDPFDTRADGCKVPDLNTFPSTPIKCTDTWSGLTTDANGLKAMAFIPFIKNTRVDGVAGTSSSWTWAAAFGGGTDSVRGSSVNSNFSLIRPVAHGLRISCVGAPTAVTGNIHVAIVSSSMLAKTTWNLPVNITRMANAMFYAKYPLAMFTQQNLTVVNKFLDMTSSRYIDPVSDSSDTASDMSLQSSGWGTILIVIEGCPANTVELSIEQIVHFEGIPFETGVDTSSPASPFSAPLQSAVSHMAGNTPGAFAEEERGSYLTQVQNTLRSGVYAFASDFWNHAVMPAAYNVGYAAAGYAARRVAYGIQGVTNFRTPSAFDDRYLLG